MSQGTPNLRVGLEVQIFGRNQMRQAQAALSALGLTIEDVQSALVNVNGHQARFHRGLINITGATHETREALTEAAQAAVQNATANARNAASITRTASAARQATNALRQQEIQTRRTEVQTRRAATEAVRAQARVDRITANMRLSLTRQISRQATIRNEISNINQILAGVRAEQGTFNAQAAMESSRQVVLGNAAPTNLRRSRELVLSQGIWSRYTRSRADDDGDGGRGGGGGGPLGAFGNVGRVIAYDMLRRTITNLYQGFWRINETLADWVIESVKFNDEMDRAKTVFQGLGMIGTKNADGTSMTIPQAELSTDPKVRAVLAQSEKNADSMMRGLMEISAMTGSDMDEVISSARQLLPDLINKRSKAGMPNPYLEKPEELNAITQQMVKLASVLKMSDPGGRPLKWHMTAIQELFSGTSGGAKDKGKEAVRSLRAREGIKMTDEEASNLAKAVNSGDLVKASQMITDTLERAGQGLQNLDNLMAKTLKPNIDGVITALRIFSMDFSDIFHKDLIAFFMTVRITIFKILNLDSYKKTMGRLAGLFSEQFGDIQGTIYDYLQKIYDDPAILYTQLEGPIRNLGTGLKAVRLGIEAVWNFIQGTFAGSLGFENLEKTMIAVRNNSYEAGVSFRQVAFSMSKVLEESTPMIETFMKISNAIAIVATAFEIAITFITEIFKNIAASVIDFSSIFMPKWLENSIFGEDLTSWASSRISVMADENQPNFEGTIGALERMRGLLGIEGTEAGQIAAAPVRLPVFNQSTIPTGYQPFPGYTAPAVQSSAMPNKAVSARPTATGTINASINDQAVVQGFKVAKPIQLNPRSVNQAVNVNIGTLTMNSDNAQKFIDDLVNLGRGGGAESKKFIGPYSHKFLDSAASSRGIQY